MQLVLADLDHTARLGRILAHTLVSHGVCPLLISGPLGAGKTALIRYVVASLPGGDNAEVSSPSFNLVNIYPTQPETVHMDLYRLGGTGLDESLIEHLESDHAALCVEWAEHLPQSALPAYYVRLQMAVSAHERSVHIHAQGPRAETWLLALQEQI
ncbi:MAG: tRNA (adenosine(37)-N6)-threonylcarbamoyltransferase complex ATPase subunit type 1 TsaE [Desulfovermiculus sp.]